jgi:steroid 5-alpha reductase family enzyme
MNAKYSPLGSVTTPIVVVFFLCEWLQQGESGVLVLTMFLCRKDEDYRWAVLRSQLPPWLFQVVNLTFISAIQNVLLLLLGYPLKLAAVSQPHDPLSASDIILASFAVALLFVEFTSDNQQYSFHTYKHAYLAAKKGNEKVEPYDARKQWLGSRLTWTPADAERGFLTRGLWAYSRHPNFACEQSFWVGPNYCRCSR